MSFIVNPFRFAGIAFEPETDVILAAFTVEPDAARKALINTLVVDMKAAGVWAKLDAFWMIRAHDAQAARVNWINPGTYDLTAVGSPTFTADAGYTMNGTSLSSNFNPSTAGGNHALNSASLGLSIIDLGGASNAASFGWYDGTRVSSLCQRDGLNRVTVHMNQAPGPAVTANDSILDGTFLLAGNRSGAAALQAYYVGLPLTLASGATAASTALPTVNYRIGTLNGTLFRNQQVRHGFIGGSLTAVEHLAFAHALRAYTAAVDGTYTIRAERKDLHMVRNAWDSENRHFAVVGNEELWVSTDGGENYSLLYTFPDSPKRTYGLFITSDDYLLVATQDHATGIDGRTYRSTDHGVTFTQIDTFDAAFHSGNISFWPAVEDSNGDIYLGQYNVENPKVVECHIWKSTDKGLNWTDVSHSGWSNSHHIHGLGIDPVNGWLYANTGDYNGEAGIWRSKLKDGSDWVRKTTSAGYQYIPLEFDGTYVYSADDMNDGSVVRFIDDGTSATLNPTVVLDDPDEHHCYYLKRDPAGRFWASMIPVHETTEFPRGAIYMSNNGTTWHKVYSGPNMPYADWYDKVGDGSASKWTLQHGTTQFGTLNNDNYFPLYNYDAVKLRVAL